MQNIIDANMYTNMFGVWKLTLKKENSNKLAPIILPEEDRILLSKLSENEIFEYWFNGISKNYRYLVMGKMRQLFKLNKFEEFELIYPWTDSNSKVYLLKTYGRIYQKTNNKLIAIFCNIIICENYSVKASSSIVKSPDYKSKYLVNIHYKTLTLQETTCPEYDLIKVGDNFKYNNIINLAPLNLYNINENKKIKNWLDIQLIEQNLWQYSLKSVISQKRIRNLPRYIKLSVQNKEYDNNGKLKQFTISIIDIDDLVRKREQSILITKIINNLDRIISIQSSKDNKESVTNILIRDFEDALLNEDFEVFYQPKYDFVTNQINGAEALVRWNYKKQRLISPIDFIPAFEENGYIIKLDKYVWKKTCQYINKYNIDIPISVNVSMKHLGETNFTSFILNLLEKYNIRPNQLCLEFTESVDYDNNQNLENTLLYLQENGLKLSLDDFGTGYSSLARLNKMPINEIKIDKSLVNDLIDDPKSKFILESIIHMSNKLNLKTVVEGIETEEQLDILKKLGFNTIQGYLFSRPLPVNDFVSLLEKTNIN
ncbi:hypothetical protein AN641_10345 [Candidatus Epulonipiscioides gigas]|nr:hypothetical protein AN641_10180 [Epulopiscium sp. SCG-C07WGA-EpuloA2]ONI43409.1 hypothetical protein AN641_10345 [Epulopiscium sp. SCG-C07WGA-EpuloA2]